MSIRSKKAKAICLAGSLAATALWSAAARAYITVGDFENGNNEGFFDWTISNGGSDNGYNPGATPSTDLPSPFYGYSSEGATLGSSALTFTGPTANTSGYYQGLSWKSEWETDTEGNAAAQDAVTNKFYEMDVTYNTAEWSGESYANLALIVNWASQGQASSGFTALAPNNTPAGSANGYPAYDSSNSAFPGGWDPSDYPGTTTRTLVWDYADYVPSGGTETLGQMIGPDPAWLEFIVVSSSDAVGTFHFDNVRLSNNQVNATWTNQAGANADGTYHWGTLTNWNGTSLPSNPGDIVTFGNAVGAPTTITLNGDEEFQVSVGTMNFTSGESYTIAQGTGGTLTLNGNTPSLTYSQNFAASTLTTTNGVAQINDAFGNHTISAPVSLATSVDIAVGQATNTFTISGNISGNGGIDLVSTTMALSAGTVLLSGSNSYSGGTTVTGGTLLIGTAAALPANSKANISGGLLQLAPGATGGTLSSVTISANGVLDITNNHIFINYGSGSDPLGTIYGYLQSGFNNGGWNGTGIISSAAQVMTNGLKYGVGFADGNDGTQAVAGLSSGQIELKYTLLGDANLDGGVNGSDFSILAANFGLGVTNWDQGNFFYASSVNGSDFSALAANFGQGDSGADDLATPADVAALDAFAAANGLPLPVIGAVPEPATVGLLLLSGAALSTRRRRRT
jgi:autotransporter-associated beta strand protein